MAPLRSNKLAQLGGMGALAAYLLLQAWWLTTVAVDDTGDDALLLLVIGAPFAFALGWFVVPAVATRLTPQAGRNRGRRRSRRSGRAKTGGTE